MSMHDLTKVLVVYAPNLAMKLDRVTQLNWFWYGNEFLQTVAQATGLGSDTCKLKSISTKYTVSFELAEAKGLVAASDRVDYLYPYIQLGITVWRNWVCLMTGLALEEVKP